MKTIIMVLVVIFFTSCKIVRNKTKYDEYHKIIKLDSINDYYLVYTSKNDSIFKIISKKGYVKEGKKVKIGKKYPIKVRSMRDNTPTIKGIKISPINFLDVNCFQFDDSTKICKEEGIYDLYFSKNLKGIYFIE
ncbi:hypothetical protein [Flavobacterium sp. I3-2]|uniref:hypothetical protein n=1 Tax=Flavobacterium sp. I3-2 TaxID=2748319 RepID=UPI0015AD9A83|nr:hypothetical protein [Flavobacterium sp. I3-2]